MSNVQLPADLALHAAFVRRLARALTHDAGAVDDLVQEAWITAQGHGASARRGRPWLGGVVRNLARRRWRTDVRRSHRERLVARVEALPPSDAVLARQELLEALVVALRGLDEPYRGTILARFYEDLPPRAIARRDGVPVETVRTRLKRGLARLRETLGRHEPDWSEALVALGFVRRGVSPVWAPLALVAASGVGALTWWALASRREPPAIAQGTIAAVPGDLALESAGLAAVREPATTPVGARLAGHVLDELGAPVANARVLVLGDEDPFGPDGTDIAWNHWQGRGFPTDGAGAWSAVLPEPARVLVAVEGTEAIEPLSPERWVDVPREDVELRVRVHPVATLVIRASDEALRPLEAFRVEVCGADDPRLSPDGAATYTGGYHARRTSSGVVELDLRVEPSRVRDLRVVLAEPGPGLEQPVHLVAGGRAEVVFHLPVRGRLRGLVVDALGQPVPDALVFFGPETRLRGDEPFKPLKPERVLDGVRTDPAGRFDLPGDGALVTVVHEAHSPATVDAQAGARIQLAPRGTILGRAVGPDGTPLRDAVVRLDRERETRTDDDGAFRFEGVEAGARGLRREGRDEWTGVRLSPGETREVLLAERALPALDLQWLDAAGRPLVLEGEPEGLAIGLGPVFAVAPVSFDATGRARLSSGLPADRYWVLTRELGGAFEVLDGAGETTSAVTATLVVRPSGPMRVQVVPGDADPFLRLVAARLAQRAAPDAPAHFRLAPGNYCVVGEAGVVLATAELTAEGFEVALEP